MGVRFRAVGHHGDSISSYACSIRSWLRCTHPRRLERRVRTHDQYTGIMVVFEQRGSERQRGALVRGEVIKDLDPTSAPPVAVWLSSAHDRRFDRRVRTHGGHAPPIVLL